MSSVDIAYLADLRFPGGTSTALINELAAAQRAGLSVAIRPLQCATLRPPRPPNGELVEAIAATRSAILEVTATVEARLALIYHPSLLDAAPERPLGIRARSVAIVAHHPLHDRTGAPQFDPDALADQARVHLGEEPLILPVGPQVRRSFERAGLADRLWHEDWPNMLDVDAWPVARRSARDGPLVIGRHSRPDLAKWPEPEVAAMVYPADRRFEFRMMGVDARIAAAFDPWPATWFARPFARGAAPEFLAGLDAYSYYHSSTWIEAFGYSLLEAMAAGLPVVLPPDFADLFGEAGLYAAPSEAVDLYLRLAEDAGFRHCQGDTARQIVRGRFGYDGFAARVERLITPKAARPPSPAGPPRGRRPDRILAVTSNGVGVGHLSRLLAIAGALPLGMETTFFTLSKAAKFAAEAGHATEYRGYHRQFGVDFARWNDWFCAELIDALAFYRPDGVLFDGNMPYGGLLDALDEFPSLARIWVRRGLWRSTDETALARARKFHCVVVPRDVARTAAPGFEDRDRDGVVHVPPILAASPERCFSRSTARRLLGLPADAETALVQLGAGSNFEMAPARERTLGRLLADPGRHVVEILSPARPLTPERLSPRHRLLTVFPIFLYHRAFDFCVSAVGYNSFHEVVAGHLPTLFIPNSAPEMDLQERRAAFAVTAGWALAARADDPYAIDEGVEVLAGRQEVRAELQAAMRRVPQDWSGAAAAAEAVTLSVRTVPRPPA